MRGRKVSVLIALVGAVVAFGVGSAWGTSPFVDIAGNNHEANINAIYDAGVTGGCDPTHYCPTNNVTRAQMGSFLARLGGLGANLPVANSHSDRQSYCSMVQAHPESFRPAPCQTAEQDMFLAGDHTALAIGADGLPIFLFRGTGHDLRMVHCTTSDCSGHGTVRVIDNASSDEGQYSSLAIGVDGFPIMSYYDGTNGDLRVAHCTSITCSSLDSIITAGTLDSAGLVGRHTSLAIGADGFPVISYVGYDTSNADLKVAHCLSVTCDTGAEVFFVDTGTSPRALPDNVGTETSIAIGPDSFPIISYFNLTDSTLKVAHCTTVNCSGTPNIRTIGPMDVTTGRTSIAIGIDGLAVVVYQGGGTLQVAHCTSAACTTTPNVTTVDDGIVGDEVGRFPSLAIGTNGKPVIAYKEVDAVDLRVTRCSTVDCTGSATVRTVDSHTATDDPFYSMAIGMDGVPVLAYVGEGGVRVVRPTLAP